MNMSLENVLIVHGGSYPLILLDSF